MVSKEVKVESEVEAAVDLHHQANKTKAKKEITQPFPENQKSITQFSLRSLKPRSIVTNKNSQDITLMLKPVARSSTSVL